MARRLFPNDEDRLAYGYGSAGSYFTSKAGSTVTIYTDAAGTTLADITDTSSVAVPGSVLTVGADSRIPQFYGPDGTPYGVDVLYAKIAGASSTVEIHGRYDDRLDRDTFIRCTSGTRPTSPSDDQLIYETDTDRFLRYDLASTQWRSPKRKYSADVNELTATVSGISTVETTLITSSVIAADGVTAFNIEGFFPNLTSTVATDVFAFRLYDGATQIAAVNRYAQSTSAGAGDGGTVVKRGYIPTAGNHTFTLKCVRSSGTGSVSVNAAPTAPGMLEVREA